MTCRIAVAGNINTDVACRVPRPPAPGETLLAYGLTLGLGGKAANASVALARLGAQPLLIGCVGQDPLGAFALAQLEREGIQCDSIERHPQATTGLASVFVAPDGENAIVTHLGANMRMSAAELPSLRGCNALLMTLGLPRPVLLALVARARAEQMPIVLDATPLRGEPLPVELLAVSVLSANRGEAETLLGHALDPADEAAIEHACRELCALGGAEAAVLKLGAAGAAWVRGTHAGHAGPPVTQTIDTTGAGDAFMAALTLRLSEGAALPEAVDFACLLGALASTGRGAQGGWSSLADVRRFAAAAGREVALA